MTRDDIEKLTGRDLDAAVATAVFGITPRLVRARESMETVEVYDYGGPDGLWLKEHLIRYHGPHPYSASWHGAGLVIDEMRRRGWEAETTAFKFCIARFEKDSDDGTLIVGCVRADSIGVAVCRAALLAVAREKGEGR